jgi:hypothetical protein
VYYLLGLVSSKLGGLAGRSSLRDEGATLFPLFGESLSDKLLVRSGLFLVSEDAAHLFGLAGTLSLQGEGGDQSLDLGGLANGLSLLVGEGTGDDVLADIVVLGQIEKLADVASALGTQTTGDRLVGQSLYGVFSGLGDDQVQDGPTCAFALPHDGAGRPCVPSDKGDAPGCWSGCPGAWGSPACRFLPRCGRCIPRTPRPGCFRQFPGPYGVRTSFGGAFRHRFR